MTVAFVLLAGVFVIAVAIMRDNLRTPDQVADDESIDEWHALQGALGGRHAR